MGAAPAIYDLDEALSLVLEIEAARRLTDEQQREEALFRRTRQALSFQRRSEGCMDVSRLGEFGLRPDEIARLGRTAAIDLIMQGDAA